jgi:hypothetical protein
MYRAFVLGDIPAAERRNALNIRIQQWSPHRETGRCVVWRNETAQVWIWDEAARKDAARAEGVSVSRVYPESLLRPPPGHDMVRIVSCVEGMEGQVWKDGILRAGRWWGAPPSPDEWARFLVAYDFAPDSTIPTPEEIPLLDRPWGKTSAGSRLLDMRHERKLLSGAIAVIALVLIWEGVAAVRLQNAQKALETRVAELAREVDPLLNARNRAMEYRQTAQRVASLAPYPAQIQLMTSIAEQFRPKDSVLVEWHYNAGYLRFVLQGKNLDPSYYVSAYQKLPYFKDVTAERGRTADQLEVKMTVVEEVQVK